MLYRLTATARQTDTRIDLRIRRRKTRSGAMLCLGGSVSARRQGLRPERCGSLDRLQEWLDQAQELCADTPANLELLKARARELARALIGMGLDAVWVEKDACAAA